MDIYTDGGQVMAGLIIGGEPCDTRLVQQLAAEAYTFRGSYIILLTVHAKLVRSASTS